MRRTDPLYLLLFVLFGAGLITGMFFDLEISSTLYSKDNTLAVIMSVIGLGLLICTLYCGLNVKFISGKSQN